MLINGILTNSEIWYGLTQNELSNLEKLDKYFFLRLLEIPRTVPDVALYLEMGALPISSVIKARRLNYLHTLVRAQNRTCFIVYL